jgi:hypothetical protein
MSDQLITGPRATELKAQYAGGWEFAVIWLAEQRDCGAKLR